MDLETATYRKVTWRLIPFLFACYILAYVDRVNVEFAKLQMQSDLGMSDTVYGTGAGLFFVGYFLLEVPANMMLRRRRPPLAGADHDRLGVGSQKQIGTHGANLDSTG